MAHINYALLYIQFSKLFKDIKTKHDADTLLPPGSVLLGYFTEQGIVPANDLLLVTASDAAHELFGKKEKLSEEKSEQRDNFINPAFAQHRELVQYLKKLKRGKVHELGNWGVTISHDDRIDYPADFLTLRLAIKAFIDKHNTYAPAPSPLDAYLNEHPEIDLAQTLLDLDKALDCHNDFLKAEKDAEEQSELRDTKFKTPRQHILGIGQFLTGLYPDNPHKAGQWGFTIDEHTQNHKKVFTLAPLAKIDLTKLDVGSLVSVDDDGEILITPKGEQALLKGSKGVVNKNNPFALSRGFSNSTIENTSSTSTVTFTAYFNH